MRRAAAVAALLGLVLCGCTSGGSESLGPGSPATTVAAAPGDSGIDVDTPELRALRAEAGIEACAPGTGSGALPAVTLPCLGGGPDVDLSTLTGPLVINFWASTCRECRIEMPVLQQLHEQYGDQVRVLGVDLLDTQPVTALEQARDRGVTYPLVADPGGDLLEQAEFARVRGLPYLAFVDADGVIAAQRLGGVESLEQMVDLVDNSLGLDLGAAS